MLRPRPNLNWRIEMEVKELAELLRVSESPLGQVRPCAEALVNADPVDMLTIILAGMAQYAPRLLEPVEVAAVQEPVAESAPEPVIEPIPEPVAEAAVEPVEPVVPEVQPEPDPPAPNLVADADFSDAVKASLEAAGVVTAEDVLAYPDLVDLDEIGKATKQKLLEWAAA